MLKQFIMMTIINQMDFLSFFVMEVNFYSIQMNNGNKTGILKHMHPYLGLRGFSVPKVELCKLRFPYSEVTVIWYKTVTLV